MSISYSGSVPSMCVTIVYKQEAQLSPSDRAMRRVSWNLANYHATVQKLLVYRTSIEQIEVMKLKRYSKAMCNNHVHTTMTRPSRCRCPVGVINKPTMVELWWYHLYTDDLLSRNFLSPQCRNCSRDPDHAPFREDFSSTRWDLLW